MSSILIKGMGVPKDKVMTINIWEDGNVYILGENPMMLYDAAVELPDHGDLIDRDVLMTHKGSAYDIDGHELYAVGTGTILRMPAVIQAERSE